MRFKSLREIEREKPLEIKLDGLPREIKIDLYAKEKAFMISELVRDIHEESVEWYGFTLASKENPESIIDIGLPRNEQNVQQYTSINPEMIEQYQESLPEYLIINGWIHSHASLEFKRFSGTDEENNITVLEYVSPSLKKPIAKKEVKVKKWSFLIENEFGDEKLREGNVCLITDVPVSTARLLETIYGSFCFCLVIGDDGWHEQQIYYKKRGILTGETFYDTHEAELAVFDSGRKLFRSEITTLAEKVRENIRPVTSPPPEQIERM